MRNTKICMETARKGAATRGKSRTHCSVLCTVGGIFLTPTGGLSETRVLSSKLSRKVKIRWNEGKTSQPTQSAAGKHWKAGRGSEAFTMRLQQTLWVTSAFTNRWFQVYFHTCLLKTQITHTTAIKSEYHLKIIKSEFICNSVKIATPNQWS